MPIQEYVKRDGGERVLLRQLNFRAVQIRGWSTVRSGGYWANWCSNPDWEIRVGGQRWATEGADWANDILCRPFRDSILFPPIYPALPCRALELFRPYGTRCVASIGLSGLKQHQGFSTWTARSN